MNLEALANELFLDLFEYLPSFSLLRAFHGLNGRFNSLLTVHFQGYNLDFRSLSKHDFDLVCQEYLPLIADHVCSIRLSNDDDTPQQIDRFYSHGLTLCHFTHVQSLSLYNVCFDLTENEMVREWQHLPYLKYLYFSSCFIPYTEGNGAEIGRFMNNIWSLPKLNLCHFDIDLGGRDQIIPPTIVSLTLEYLHLSVNKFFCRWDDTICLFQNTPGLRYLCGAFDICDHDHALPVLLSLTESHIGLTSKGSCGLTKFLQSMPNLYRLRIELDIDIINGHQWEQIITINLPKLKVFRFKMEAVHSNKPGASEEGINELIGSFRSPFWVDKHQRFVQCDADVFNQVMVYSLPYAFNDWSLKSIVMSKSTSPNISGHCSYNRVRRLFYRRYNNEESSSSGIQFFNIHYLDVERFFNETFWLIVPRVDSLISLKIYIQEQYDTSNVWSQLQDVLNRAPHLYSLKISSTSSFLPLSNLKSASIRRLALDSLTTEECAHLSCSPLGVQCEVLRIRVKKWISILGLLNTMTYLRALSFHANDDIWKKTTDPFARTDDELVRWMQHQLPFMYTITRDSHYIQPYPDDDGSYVHVWIR